MCLYPLIKFSCCGMQYKPTDEPPIVKFCARGRPDTLRGEPFPACAVRQPHACNDFFRLPIKCPEHKLAWLTEMDLNDACQATDARLLRAGVADLLRFRYRDKMARAFEMVAKCADRMEAERLQAWKVKMFCTGAALELLGTAIVGSDAKPLDYSVLERLRERLLGHINAEAEQLIEEAARGEGLQVGEGNDDGEEDRAGIWASSLSPPHSPLEVDQRSCTTMAGDQDENISTPITTTGQLHPFAQDLLARQPNPHFFSYPRPRFPSHLMEPVQLPMFHSVPSPPSQFPHFLPSQSIGPLINLRAHGTTIPQFAPPYGFVSNLASYSDRRGHAPYHGLPVQRHSLPTGEQLADLSIPLQDGTRGGFIGDAGSIVDETPDAITGGLDNAEMFVSCVNDDG